MFKNVIYFNKSQPNLHIRSFLFIILVYLIIQSIKYLKALIIKIINRKKEKNSILIYKNYNKVKKKKFEFKIPSVKSFKYRFTTIMIFEYLKFF